MNSKRSLLLALLVGAVAGLAACCTGTVKETPTLEDTTWVLVSYVKQNNLQAVLKGTEITALFDSTKGQVVGSAGCNSYIADYEINDNELSIIPVSATMMHCPEPGVMEQEGQYLELLETAETYHIQNGQLTISSSGNQILIFLGRTKLEPVTP